MSANNRKGRDLLLEISDDAGVTWKLIGGVRTKELNRDNPISDTTSQSTTGNETEACYNGYSTVTLNGNGVVDVRTGAALIAYKELSAIANSSDPVALLRFSDADETYEGDFNITSFSKNSEQNGIVEFSAAFQNSGAVAYAQL